MVFILLSTLGTRVHHGSDHLPDRSSGNGRDQFDRADLAGTVLLISAGRQ